MKHLNDYNTFNIKPLKENINLDEDRLIDFKDLGFDVDINSSSSSIILDFNKKAENENDFHIKASEIDDYNSGITKNSLTIQFNSEQYIQCNIDELETIYDDFTHYLNVACGLVPNYIYFGNLKQVDLMSSRRPLLRAIYFKDFKSLREFLNLRAENFPIADADIDPKIIKTNGFTIGYYKK